MMEEHARRKARWNAGLPLLDGRGMREPLSASPSPAPLCNVRLTPRKPDIERTLRNVREVQFSGSRTSCQASLTAGLAVLNKRVIQSPGLAVGTSALIDRMATKRNKNFRTASATDRAEIRT
jgi:hypothetical protein